MDCTTTRAQDRGLFRHCATFAESAKTSSPDSIGTAFQCIRTLSLGAVIVALSVAGGALGVNAQTPSEDLSGRWTSQRHGYVLDVTRCGAEWCGIKLNSDQSCGALALRLAPASSMDEPRGFIGTLNLEANVQTYKVSATGTPIDATRPTEIHLLGNPNMPPQPMTRMIQFQDMLVRGLEATCSAERKLS